jgi:rhodanese-related sulfurtransferase
MRRNHIIIAIVLLVPAIIAAIYFTLYTGESKDYIGKITKTEGKAVILKIGELRASPVEAGLVVELGDIIRTMDESKVEITFTDGSVVGLAANSKIDIMDYLVEGTERRKGLIKLSRGKLRAIVTKASKGAKPGRFNVITPTAITGVRGTDFFVFHVKGLTKLAVKEGSVDIYNPTKCADAVDGDYYRKDCGNVVVDAGRSTRVMADFKPEPPKLVTQEEMIIFTEETTIAYVEPPSDPNLEPILFAEEGVQSPIMTASAPKGLPPVHRMPEPLKPLEEISPRDVGRISTADLMKRLNEGKEVLIFDVRDKKEYDASLVKIKGSVRVPMNHMVRVAKKLPPGRMIVTYCSKPKEATSSMAASILMNNGYQTVFVLEGGINSWEFYDFPLVYK